MTSADNSPYNANTITFLLIIKLYANDIIVRIHIKIAFSHNIMVSEGNIVAFPLNIIMTAQDIMII